MQAIALELAFLKPTQVYASFMLLYVIIVNTKIELFKALCKIYVSCINGFMYLAQCHANVIKALIPFLKGTGNKRNFYQNDFFFFCRKYSDHNITISKVLLYIRLPYHGSTQWIKARVLYKTCL